MSVLLYHEPQVAALCGVHCINALLQGPYFSEIDLAQIAQELDALERQMMQENGVHTEDYLKYMAEASGNVADNGMFSIQVLSKAVEQFGLQLVPLNNPEVVDAKQQPQDQEAFLCNLQEHWFAIRKVDGEWWNFNSLFPAPAPLSSFYLAAFLDTLRHQGYTIFVVQGQFPVRHADQMDSPGAGQWYSPDEARFLTKDAEGSRKRGRAMNAFETAMAQATAGGSSLQLASKHSGAAAGKRVQRPVAYTR